MQLTHSFLTLPQNFATNFTTPPFETFVRVLTGWNLKCTPGSPPSKEREHRKRDRGDIAPLRP